MNKPDAENSTSNTADKGGVAALDRAFAILAAFTPAAPALTLAELAARTGLYKSTILRIAQSLLQHRFLQRLEDGRYQIGPAPLILGALYQRNLKLGDILLPLMRELGAQCGESLSFYVRDGDVRVCLHRVDSRHTVRDHVAEGDVLPLEHGSGGRVLGAFAGLPGEPYDTIRRDFFCHSSGERDPDTAGISAPVFGPGQRLLGALTVAGPRSRIDQTFIDRMRAPLLAIAARATAALGGDALPLETARADHQTSAGRKARNA
ncbi:MAG: IclR family transcriptional regulator [Noviherbaspirillum sp.]